jgi:hypothetical protein
MSVENSKPWTREKTSRYRQPYIYQWITVRDGVGVNRNYGGISPEVGGALLCDFFSSYIPNCS